MSYAKTSLVQNVRQSSQNKLCSKELSSLLILLIKVVTLLDSLSLTLLHLYSSTSGTLFGIWLSIERQLDHFVRDYKSIAMNTVIRAPKREFNLDQVVTPGT